MTGIPTITVTPSAAAGANARVDGGDQTAGGGFGGAPQRGRR